MNRILILLLAFVSLDIRPAQADTFHVGPADSLASVREKLEKDSTITEVVFAAGTYIGSLYIFGRSGSDFSKTPLVVRSENGARVLFDGSKKLEKFDLVAESPGVYVFDYSHPGGEYPKFWEPRTRQRYKLVADRQSVIRFPSTYTVERIDGHDRLLFHTSTGAAPVDGDLLISSEDNGMFINRPYVTVHGISFQNFLAREKWSTGIDLRVDHITVEDCNSTNCSMGFVVTGKHNTLRRCATDDVGGGVYVGGEDATVENCRFFKQRDSFMVPSYAQDDTGIQYYVPAKGGLIRGNLCEGFGMGVFIKAHTAPYVVEHNTLIGLGQGLGFGSTSWHPDQRFRYNIISDCSQTVEIFTEENKDSRHIDFNSYWSSEQRELKKIGANDIVADPKFVWPAWRDYNLQADSPCLKLSDENGACGAFGPETSSFSPNAPTREWHVSEKGRDGSNGTMDEPVRTIQFAVDRARPGDQIIVHPGIYPNPVKIKRGGTKERPIVLRAAKKWEAILDSNRQAATMIQIEKASDIELHDFEIRWYGSVAIGLKESPRITVAGCRIWNAHWHGAWPTGTAVRAERSPGFIGHHNLFFQQEHAFWFYNSPNVTVTNNTCAGNLYSAAAFLYSCENSICQNNSFAFQGNDVIVIEEDLGRKDRLKTFKCDYNNYGTALREQPPGTIFDTIHPREKEPHFHSYSKAIVNYSEYKGSGKRYVSINDWRTFSGLDAHTIIADPLYLNSAARDFGLDPKSPNRGAGAAGAIIGALKN
jgi:hypothetical protein